MLVADAKDPVEKGKSPAASAPKKLEEAVDRELYDKVSFEFFIGVLFLSL